MRNITIDDISVHGEELTDDRLNKVFGGMPPNDPYDKPTVDTEHGHYDAPGTAGLSHGHDVQL